MNRDWDRTIATVRLLKEQMGCDRVLIAVPYENDLARSAQKEIQKMGGMVVTLQTITAFLK